MIQFNLLPDVKLEYIKARRTKRTVVLASILVASASFAVFVLFFLVVNVAQKEHLNHLQNDIDTSKKQLESKPDLAKILTIQNQLNSLSSLHQNKPVASRVLNYMQQLTPQNVSISGLTIDFGAQTIKIDGSTDSFATVNTFADTLKFTTYSATDQQQGSSASAPAPAFSQVVLSNFAVTNGDVKDKNKATTYTITLSYNPDIFSGSKAVTLQIPKQITTRSETEKPAVFQAKPATSPTQGAN